MSDDIKRFCESCGHEITGSKNFCEKCGNQINHNKSCSKCGAPLEENNMYCTRCGSLVGDLPQNNYNLFLIFGYLGALAVLFIDGPILGVLCSLPIGLYLMTRPETQQNKILYLHGVILVVMPLVFLIIRMLFL